MNIPEQYKKLKSGNYHVKHKGKWTIGYFTGGSMWYLIDSSLAYTFDALELIEINPILAPETASVATLTEIYELREVIDNCLEASIQKSTIYYEENMSEIKDRFENLVKSYERANKI